MYVFEHIHTYIDFLNILCVCIHSHTGTYLHDNTPLLMDAAIQGIGILGKTYSLPLPTESDNELNKKALVETLFSILSNVKLNTKVCFLIYAVVYYR